VNNAPGYIGNMGNSTSVAGGCAIYSGTGVLLGSPLIGTPCGGGVSGSISQALGSLNSSVTTSEVAAAVLSFQRETLGLDNENSLPASEGSTGRGDSVSIPTTKNGEINSPIGASTSDGFKPVTSNNLEGGRATNCIQTGVKLPPELSAKSTCGIN
jgi:hypothetical protein